MTVKKFFFQFFTGVNYIDTIWRKKTLRKLLHNANVFLIGLPYPPSISIVFSNKVRLHLVFSSYISQNLKGVGSLARSFRQMMKAILIKKKDFGK